MQKVISKISLLLLSAAMFTGCLKDKGFENQEYGIKDPSGGAIGISIPEASSGSKSISIDAVTTPQVVALFDINLESDKQAPSDLHVNLTLNPTLVADYNSANGTSAVSFTAAQYTFTPKITIAAGKRLGTVQITVPNAASLNLSTTYALGLTISSVDEAGYTIASNLKSIVVLFNIKNKFDGIYRLRGNHNRTTPDYTLPYNVKVQLITSGPNSVVMWYPTPGPNTYAHPINGSAGSYYGSLSPDVTFASTLTGGAYLATGIQNWAPYGATPPMAFWPGDNSRCKFIGSKPDTMFLSWNYNANPLRRFFDTLSYIGPR